MDDEDEEEDKVAGEESDDDVVMSDEIIGRYATSFVAMLQVTKKSDVLVTWYSFS